MKVFEYKTPTKKTQYFLHSDEIWAKGYYQPRNGGILTFTEKIEASALPKGLEEKAIMMPVKITGHHGCNKYITPVSGKKIEVRTDQLL